MAPYPFTNQDLFFCVSNSCSIVISERSSYHLDRKISCLETFLDQDKRLLGGSRVQSRSRGTRTMPYANWCSECQSTRMKGERLLQLCLGQNGERYGKQTEMEGDIEESRERPTKGCSRTVKERQRCPDQQTKYPRVAANDHHWKTNHVIWQGKNDSSVQLDNSSRRLPFGGGSIQFWTTKQ